MDLLSFIWTVNPTKVRVAERQRVENEPRLLESTVRRVVSLLPIALAHASSKLEASIDKLFYEGDSGDGQDTDIQPVAVTADTIVENMAPLQPRRQRKKETVVADAGSPSHPPKKLREDYEALGGAFTGGKSMSAVQSLFTEAVLNAEARGEPIVTLPFVTSSVSATPERKDKSPADSVTGLNLRTIGAPQRFVISSDSSHHSGANIAEAEVDSIVRSSAPAITIVTTVTAAIEADATAARAPVAPSLFGVGSSSTGRTDFIPGGFSDVSGSDFLIGGIHTIVDPDSDLQKVYVSRWSATKGYGLDDSQKRKLRAVVDEQAELLKVEDGEIESLKAQLLLKEAEAIEAIRLRAENDNLVDQVHGQEISSAGLQEKVAAYEDFICQREKFQNKKLKEWLLTYGMELVVVKCLNSNEYLSALGAAISKVVEKGMQEGLSVGITHGAEGRKVADVAAYNPSAKADYLVDTIMNLLRLDDVLSKRLGLTESQTYVNQLMVPIHHFPDQRVVGAFALSLSLEVSHSRVKKMIENIAKHVSALHGMFVPLSEPLSAAALEGMEGTFGSAHDTTTTLSTAFVFASTIPPISTDDYKQRGVEYSRVDPLLS
nr:hypothetical protein [Tanacetum cinerariifolium]